MPYEYCNVKIFPQDHRYNICNFSITTQRFRGCQYIVENLRNCGIESVIEKSQDIQCESKNVCYINETCYVKVLNSKYNKINNKQLTANKCDKLINRLHKVTQ